ncbi:GGDEF domain-containing protein [Pengzhenrongella frigida]|uniref:GGDEF domain-containing protein n=1 Tax=Pengzhenrongella frigida TaxID=1259133 RepID=A0A4Q5N045_9MICO|nr:GGDEF domain-containing protein [Cellulomonas sp. HLT2-17]RYV51418.1 GGDEF domain-containing protein [Cellulomonas sp. HLT2-17]
MIPWISAHRARFLAIVAVLLAGAVMGSLLDSFPARLVTFLLALGIATAIGGVGTSRGFTAPSTSADERDLAAEQRDLAARQRDQEAEHRDYAADHRDEAADHRDDGADLRDQDAAERDRDADQRERLRLRAVEASETAGLSPGSVPDLDQIQDTTAARTRALHDRSSGWTERTAAELDRDAALADRGASAGERSNAERDRDAAMADRGASAREREFASVDGLTGALLRGVGMIELEHEHVRARRTNQPLALAFIDVDHLKALNDSRGHPAGDRMLREVAETLRASLRPYDLVIRYGGDEFICVLSGMDLLAAAARLSIVNTTLANADEPGSVTIGLAELQPGEPVDQLVARADAALLKERQRRRTGGQS